MKEINDFNEAVKLLKELNGITNKTAERLVVDLTINKQKINDVKAALQIIESKFGECERCFYLTINGKCPICSNLSRNQSKILVTSSFLEAKAIEDSQAYDGLYAIIKGEINLSKGIDPSKLKITNLFNRINLGTELILAFNTTFNGEVTANYIKDLAINQQIKVSRLAKGIPSGGTLKTIDQATLFEAINNRIIEE